MKPTLILLAGYPGTGKSYLANIIKERFPFFQICSPDDIKEELWDRYGFDDLTQKEQLIDESWKIYYRILNDDFHQGKSVISDYPFSDKQRSQLECICHHHHVNVFTIRLVGNLEVLFERQKKRDLDENRHLGHIVLSYHKGMQIKHDQADNLLTFEEFKKRCTTRGYGEFAMQKTVEIDVSDFSNVHYEELLDEIEEYMKTT